MITAAFNMKCGISTRNNAQLILEIIVRKPKSKFERVKNLNKS